MARKTALFFVLGLAAPLAAQQTPRIPVQPASQNLQPTSGSTPSPPPPVLVAPGGPALGGRITQGDILTMTLDDIRREGRRIFSTPFNKFDGYGDGPLGTSDKTSPGGRPTMGNNGTFMRVNGLDSQACVECHGILSSTTIPPTFAIGGVAGISATAMPGPTEIDIDDSDGNGFAFYNGRLINPPFVWGSGGVELVAKEMTIDLQNLKATAMATPDTPVALVTKGVDFGTITYVSGSGTFDTSGVDGVDPDLVVKPFGRKGNNATVRVFDLGALAFHQGMQAEELTDDMDGDGVPDPGVDNDADGDGVFNEVLPGEVSALHVFAVASDKPRQAKANHPQVVAGFGHFQSVGCVDCHIPMIDTNTTMLPVAFPEVATDPNANVFIQIDLTKRPAFKANGSGGVEVPMFSDLKRHHMGSALAETTGGAGDPFFITPRLWAVGDTGPYMHDGRALTLHEAILMHGGDAQYARDAYVNLNPSQASDLLIFLDSLKAPRAPNSDL